MNMKNCAIYTRVSTDNQAEKEFSSCEAQEQKIRSFITSQNDWQVFKVYNDAGFSGAILQRPALQELLADLKKEKIDVVLVYKIDRLTRSPKDFYQLIEFFEQYKIDFISVTERFDTSTPAGRLLRNIMLTFAQFERELASERTKDKMLERAKKGMWNGGIPPFGYKKENKKLVIDKKEAEIVRLMFDTYIETGSLVKVYELLKERGVKNRQGNPFYKNVLDYHLRNIVYAGKIKYANQIYQGNHQPIISEKIFALAQKIHKKKIRKFRVYKDFLFGGLVNCGECGFKMTSCFTNKRGKRNPKRYYYYRCTSTLRKDWQSCSTKQVSSERLERYVLENLERISMDRDYVANLVFKLEHNLESSNPEFKKSSPPHRSGFELRQVCSNFSPETILSNLRLFLSVLAKQRGVERNLLAKRFIKGILYSQENIKITLFYSENSKNFQFSQTKESPALLSQGRAKFLGKGRENSLPPQQSEFVLFNSAPYIGRNPNLF